jgi:predicted transcriptional regulator
MSTRGKSRYYNYEVSQIEMLPRGGEVIRSHRFRTISCVAEHFGVSGGTIRRWLKGERIIGWRTRFVIERIHEPAIEEIEAQSVLLTSL